MNILNALFDHATESIIIVNDEGKIIRMNPSSEKLFGYKMDELYGKEIEILIPIKNRENHLKYREEFQKNPHSRSMGKSLDIKGLTKNGQEIPLQVSLSYFHDDRGKLHVICFIVDDTERKAQEERIKKINAELEEKVLMRTRILQEAMHALENSREELKQALEHEKELNAMKSRFVSMASHEFRTPLSTILSSASLIEKYAGDNEKILNHVKKIKNSVSNLTFILNDFLSVGKLEDGKITAVSKEIHLNEFIQEIINDMKHLLKKGQEIHSRFSSENLYIHTDPNMLRNILINLLSNAIKFSPEEKKICISVSKNDAMLELSVKDEGMGIPTEEQKHLFTRFFRADNATNIQGTGLGLYIVKKMVEMLKGDITFVSNVNSGTEFTVKLPDYEQNSHH
ncbi:MAG: PAS domain-containing sensor histidine kinase [Bacteroidia bacterium]|nr:PAS domain-containing sensor histidine kinase [Bacteroidia bacterium]